MNDPITIAQSVQRHASQLADRTERTDLARTIIGLASDLAGEATFEDWIARWPGKGGDGVPVSGGGKSDPTQRRGLDRDQGGTGPDWVNQKRADHICAALREAKMLLSGAAEARNGQVTVVLTETVKVLKKAKGQPKKARERIPDCTVKGCEEIATLRSPEFVMPQRPKRKNRCNACYEWERSHRQERRSR